MPNPRMYVSRPVGCPQVDLAGAAALIAHNDRRMHDDDRHGRRIYWANETRHLIPLAARLLDEVTVLRAVVATLERERAASARRSA